VTLVADRGLVGPTLLDSARTYGWEVVVRLRNGPQEAGRVRLPDGSERRIVTLVTGPGQRWHSPARILKDAGWRDGWLTIWWARDAAEPWILCSTRPGGAARVREDRRRARIEATFQDWKRRGFRLEQSRVTDADRLERLLLVVSLAYWWLLGLGRQLIRRGQRPRHERADRRDLSQLHLGVRLLQQCVAAATPPPWLYRQTPLGLHYRWPS
jgi:hypothetical protein